MPVSHGQQVLAALNLYSRTARSFTAGERDRAQRFADLAAGGVAIAFKLARRAELTEDLQAALAGRAVIDQALGIIMGQRRCSVDEAFGVLREVSQTSNVKLREVAARLIMVTSGGSISAGDPQRVGPRPRRPRCRRCCTASAARTSSTARPSSGWWRR